MSSLLKLEKVKKAYPSFTLKEVSFELKPGQIMGFIGRNGAGKTTLLNIIAGKEVIQELVASRFTQDNVEKELRRLLHDTAYREQMLQEYQQIHAILGTESAPHNAASIICKQ